MIKGLWKGTSYMRRFLSRQIQTLEFFRDKPNGTFNILSAADMSFALSEFPEREREREREREEREERERERESCFPCKKHRKSTKCIQSP